MPQKHRAVKKAGDGPADNPQANDRRLRTLLKPLLPAGAKLSPLTLQCSFHPSEAKGIDPSMGLETWKDKVKLPVQWKEQEVVAVRLHTLSTLAPQARADALVARIQPRLRPHGYQALVAARHQVDFASIFNTGIVPASTEYGGTSLLVFYKAGDPFGLLYACGTNGVNLGDGLGTGDIVRRLKQWAGECDCTLLGAGFDWVRLKFKTVPKDVTRFGGELYLLCPEGFSDVPEDGVPDDVWRRRPEEQDELARRIGEALGFRTAADLKPYLGHKKELFLWWD